MLFFLFSFWVRTVATICGLMSVVNYPIFCKYVLCVGTPVSS